MAAALRVASLAELGLIRRELRERESQAAEAAARRAAEEAARQRERNAFALAVGPVLPLRAAPRVEMHRPRPAPLPLQRRLDEAQVMRDSLSDDFDAESLLETDDQLGYRRTGIGIDVLKKLRCGVWVLQGQLDLHGLTRDAARQALVEFLHQAGKRGWRCVRVVHGKGLGSPGRQPVLKAKVRSWLVQRQEVLAFAQARGHDGGAGALIVLLDSSVRKQGARKGG
jgi:DNA-nicking Smr family endonuclease